MGICRKRENFWWIPFSLASVRLPMNSRIMSGLVEYAAGVEPLKATAVRRGDLKLRSESGVETISYGR